jgi:tetraacyldisaccharide 4'-kinase
MRDPSFWWRAGSWQARLLRPLGAIYGTISGKRMARPGVSAGVPVVCVGNFTLGGTGKTPTAILLARALSQMGERPVILSRGYGGTEAGPLIADPVRHGAADIGDEPLLLARSAPVVISRDRVIGARLAREAGASLIIMDDGFQNPSLKKDLSLIVIDARRGLGNERVFPAGPLRAPVNAQLARTDGFIVIGATGETRFLLAREAAARGIPHWRASFRPQEESLAALGGGPVLAFTGIGDPQRFFATLRAHNVEVAESVAFADHHAFSADELASLCARAERAGLVPVTTEKDHVRISTNAALAAFAPAIHAFAVDLVVAEEPTLIDFIAARIGRAR